MLQVIAGHPHPPAGQRRGPAELLSSFHHENASARDGRRQRRGEPGRAGPGHQHVDGLRQAHGVHPAAASVASPAGSRGSGSTPVHQLVHRRPGEAGLLQRGGEAAEVDLGGARRGVRPGVPPGVADVRQGEVLGRLPDPFGRVLDGQRVGHVVGEPQPRRVEVRRDLGQVAGPAQVAVRAVLQRERDAELVGPGQQPVQALVQHGPGRVVRGRGQRVPAARDDDHVLRAQVRGQLDVGQQLALAQLAELRVGADQVDVGKAGIDRDAPAGRGRSVGGSVPAVRSGRTVGADRCGGAVVSSMEPKPCRASARSASGSGARCSQPKLHPDSGRVTGPPAG